jgi:hypothetical protein
LCSFVTDLTLPRSDDGIAIATRRRLRAEKGRRFAAAQLAAGVSA